MRVYLVLVAVLATLAMAQRRPHMPHMPHKPHMPHTPHQPHQPHRPHRSHSHRHGRHRNKNSHDDDDDDNDELPAAAPAPATLPGAGPPGVIPGPDGKPVNVQLGTVYMIRHAEHLDRSGRELDRASSERADCIARMFGPESGQNITKIIVPAHKTSGKSKMAYDTVLVLARRLNIPIMDSCLKDDPDCVTSAVLANRARGNVLVCWDHAHFTSIARSLGVRHPGRLPSKSHNQLWTIPPPYNQVTSKTLQACPGLDDMPR